MSDISGSHSHKAEMLDMGAAVSDTVHSAADNANRFPQHGRYPRISPLGRMKYEGLNAPHASALGPAKKPS